MSGEADTADALPPTMSATGALENAVEESRRKYDRQQKENGEEKESEDG